MPDHLHLLIRGNEAISNMLDFVKISKQRTGFNYLDKRNHPLWMKDYYDHIIRNEQDFDDSVSYIANNPVRAGLVDDPLDDPNLGSLVDDVGEIIK
jgi:REP element-mobilizing transposase RayT